MTLFTLLIVMALERVVSKSSSWHITSIAQTYFSRILPYFTKKPKDLNDNNNNSSEITKMLLIAALPAIGIWILIAILPGFFVFLLYLVTLWVCLGCPNTRKAYKCYLQAANRNDLQACALHSEHFGIHNGDLTNIAKQLVLINYRHYAAVIIFFVLLGLPGLVFYCVSREWFYSREREVATFVDTVTDDGGKPIDTLGIVESENGDLNAETENEVTPIKGATMLMLILDWIPARITALGFLLVGHFSSGLPVWLETFATPKISAYDLLGKVAKASEEVPNCENYYLQEPLHMVKLVKRNVVFLLMLIAVLTLVGIIS